MRRLSSLPCRRAVVVGCLPLLLVATGCGAGVNNITYHERTVVNAASASVAGGQLKVLNAFVVGPVAEGKDAEMRFAAVNAAQRPDTVVGATLDLGSGRTVDGQPQLLQENEGIPSASASSSASAGGGSSNGAGGGAAVLPNFGSIANIAVVFPSVPAALHPGQWFPVTIRFQNAGEAMLKVPVVQPEQGFTPLPSVSASASESPSMSPSTSPSTSPSMSPSTSPSTSPSASASPSASPTP